MNYYLHPVKRMSFDDCGYHSSYAHHIYVVGDGYYICYNRHDVSDIVEGYHSIYFSDVVDVGCHYHLSFH